MSQMRFSQTIQVKGIGGEKHAHRNYGRQATLNKKQTPTDEQLTAYLIQQIDLELSKPSDAQDMHYIDECNEFLKQINGDRYSPDPERKLQQLEELRQRIHDQSAEKVIRTKRFGRRAMAILCAIVAVFCASVLITSAISQISPLDVLERWGRVLFSIPYDEEIVENKMTFIRNGEVKQYGSIDELLEQEQLNILIPTWLPDGVCIQKLTWLELDHEITININFNVEDIFIRIKFGEKYYKKIEESSRARKLDIEGEICYLIPVDLRKELVYCKHGYTYSISADDIEILKNILKGLR